MGWGRQSLYFSRVPVADAVHTQGLLRPVPTQGQRGHLPALPLQVPDGSLSYFQLLLLCLRGAQAVVAQARLS